jgi:2,4-dienoyl-CoA reductase (NADPH2)
LAAGDADLVSMARPLLADPQFVTKAAAGQPQRINTCIACNQACLDHTFQRQVATCLVNPRAGRETELNYLPTARPRRIAVVGAGPAGLACATVAAQRGHQVSLFDQAQTVGGQFNLARQIPGKEEFNETLRYYRELLQQTGVQLQLGHRASADELQGFDEIVLATGVTPRKPTIEGIDHAKVLGYLDVLRDHRPVGRKVAIIGAGGIGFDVAEYLAHDPAAASPSLSVEAFAADWGIDTRLEARGGIVAEQPLQAVRDICLLQRKTDKPGRGLGKTTGWIHRLNLGRRGIHSLSGVSYRRIDDDGLHITVDGQDQVLAVDHVVTAGSRSRND